MKLKDLTQHKKDTLLASVASMRSHTIFMLDWLKANSKVSDDQLRSIKKQWEEKNENFNSAYQDRLSSNSVRDTYVAYREVQTLANQLQSLFPEYSAVGDDFSE